MACPKNEAAELPDLVLSCQIGLRLYTGQDVPPILVSPNGLSACDNSRSYDPYLNDRYNKVFRPLELGSRATLEAKQRRAHSLFFPRFCRLVL